MAFKIKDLLINDLSEPGVKIEHIDARCLPRTEQAVCATNITLPVGDVPLGPFDPGESLTSLRNLKEQLKEQLDQIEKRQSDLEKNLEPQTVEEVDTLSAKLTKALEDLDQLRAELAKKRG